MCLLILVMGILSLTRMVVDIFPTIDIPVVIVVWNYPGLTAEDMERRVVLISERAFSTTVNGISRIESQSIPGIGMLKVYFEPGTDIGAAIAQISSVASTILRIVPPGMTPPIVIQFNASNVPVAQLTASSDTMPEQKIFDYGLNFIRVRLFTIPGLAHARALRRQAAPDQGRHRPAGHRGARPVAAGRRQRAAGLERDPARGRRAHRRPRVRRHAQHQPAERRGLQRHPRQGRQRRHGAARRRRARPRRLRRPEEHRARRRQARDLPRDPRSRPTRRRSPSSTPRATRCPAIKATAPEGLELKLDFDQSVFVRGAIARRRARGRHRGGARLAHDRRLPRQLAQRAHRLHVDPAGDLRRRSSASSSRARRSTS